MATYKFHESIGGGGFGVVYEATRINDKWRCAAKFLKKDYSDKDLHRFKREVKILTQLNHPNIVPIMGMKLSADPPWFIMPLAILNLRQYLEDNRGEENLWVFKDVAYGIEHAHNNGVIHRDLKPENILFFNEDDAYAAVSDFGLGCRIERDTPPITSSHIAMGTIQYC
ncbi:protein kinase family protein, partial [Candidatus Latescibacterota bacterium]